MTKTNKMTLRPAKIQFSLGIRPVWSESSLSAWRKLGSLATHWAHNEDSDQTGRMPRLIWVFAGRTLILLVLSCRGSLIKRAVKHRGLLQSWTLNLHRSDLLYLQNIKSHFQCKKRKSTPNTPKIGNALVQLIRMEESIRQRWVMLIPTLAMCA